MNTKCQTNKNCPETPAITLIVSCIEQHLTESLTCRTHLQTLAALHQENKLYCHCGKQIITALYKHRNTIRNLNEEEENPWNNPKPTQNT